MRSRAALLGCLLIPLFLLASCGQTGTSTAVLRSATPPLGTPAPCSYATQWRPPAGNVQLNDLAMVSPDEGWAVGNTAPNAFGAPGSPSPAGVIYHFIDGQWVRLPETYANSPLVSLSMDSPTDGWAFSSPQMSPIGRVVVLHYTLGQWHPVDVPALDEVVNGGGFLMSLSVQMFGPSAGWMFAWTGVQQDPNNPNSRGKVVILRYANGVWTTVAAPPVTVTTQVFGLSAVSANEAWTVGTDYGDLGDLKVVIAHYVNGAWSLWPKIFAGNSDQSITMLSPTDGWAAYDPNDSLGTVLLHYDGTAWAPVATPAQWTSQRVFLTHLVYSVNSDVTWFGASTDIPGTFASKPLIEQYAQGQWEELAWPFATVEPQALAAGTANELWGVGNIAHQEGCAPAAVTNIDQGVFLHFQQGHWSEQVLA